MRIVLQRVKKAKVKVEQKVVGEIADGFVLLLAVRRDDTEKDADWLIEKILKLRLFPSQDNSFQPTNSFMERNILEVGGSVLIISQFTLYGDCRKGTRPSFTDSAPPKLAEELYHYFITRMRESNIRVEVGVFAAKMEVELVNDGPVTLILDSSS